MANEVEVDLILKIEKAEKAIEKFTKQTEDNLGFLSKSAASFVGNLASDLAQNALSNIIGLLKDSVNQALEAEKATSKLNNAFRLTGIQSKGAVDSIKDFAEEIQRTTTLEDDAVVSAAALLQTMARLDSQGLKRATQAAVDLSAALGIDLDSAVRLVGKAAEGNISAFSRYGVEIRKGKDDTETFNNTLLALEERFGGSAQAKLDTYSGRIENFKNRMSELQETIGTGLLRSIDAALGALQSLSSKVDEVNLAETMSDLEGVSPGLMPGAEDEQAAQRAAQQQMRMEQTQRFNDELRIQDESSKAEAERRNKDFEEKRLKANKEANEKTIQQEQMTSNVRKQLAFQAVGFAQAAGTAIAQVAGANAGVFLAINKAAAVADVLIKDSQARAAATAASATMSAFAGPGALGAFAAAQAAYQSAITASTAFSLGTIAAQTVGEVAMMKKSTSSAKDGIDYIPEDKMTWVASRGERVVGSRLNEDLMDFLGREKESPVNQGLNNVVNISVSGVIGEFGDESRKMLADSVIQAIEFQNVSRRGVI